MERRFNHLPDALYFSALLPLLSWLPPRLSYGIARGIGRRIARNFPGHRKLIVEQIKRGFADSSGTHNADEVADQFYEVMVAEDLDAFYYPAWSRRNIESVFSLRGVEQLDRQVQEGQGAVLFTAHVGGVSSALVALGLLGYPLTHLAREYPEESTMPVPFYRYALKKVALMEKRLGRPLIYAGAPGNLAKRAQTVLEVSRCLKQGGFVSMAIDVPPSRVSEAAEAAFLGRRCSFPTNFIRIATDLGVPLIPFFTWRNCRCWWRQVLFVGEPIIPSGNLASDLQSCVSIVEGVVREHPEEWFAWDSMDHFLSERATTSRNSGV